MRRCRVGDHELGSFVHHAPIRVLDEQPKPTLDGWGENGDTLGDTSTSGTSTLLLVCRN